MGKYHYEIEYISKTSFQKTSRTATIKITVSSRKALLFKLLIFSKFISNALLISCIHGFYHFET